MLRFIYYHLKKHFFQFAVFVIFALLTTILSIIMPYYNGIFIDSIMLNKQINTVIIFACFIGLLSISAIIINYVYGLLVVKIKLKLSYSLYMEIITHLQRTKLLLIQKINPSYLNQRINEDISSLWEFVLGYLISFVVKCLSVFVLILFLAQIYVPMVIAVFIVTANLGWHDYKSLACH